MPTVTNTVTRPDGTPIAGVLVEVRLVASTTDDEAPGWVTATDTEILGRWSAYTNVSGTWSLALEPNANLTPAGTVYEVYERAPGRSEGTTYQISVAAAPSTQKVRDILTVAPSALPAAGAVAHSLADAAGDLLVATAADVFERFGVGSDGQVLTADSAQPKKIKWAAATGGAPSGAAGGVLSGTYPNPGFALVMATQLELDTHAAAADPHTAYVQKATFDANSILKADTDNTPIALSVGASQVIGRKASGSIVAMTMDELTELVAAKVNRRDTLANRPAASTALAGVSYHVTDDDGGTDFYCNGLGWVQTAAGLAEAPVAHGFSTHGPNGSDSWARFVRKTANELVTSSTTIQDDDHLFFPVAANEVWVARFVLFVTGDTTGDFNMSWLAPALASGQFTAVGGDTANTASAGNARFGAVRDLAANVAFAGIGTGTKVYVTGDLIVVNGANSGNARLRWAQLASSATATTVYANSYVLATRVA